MGRRGGTAVGRAVFVFWEEEKNSPQRTQRKKGRRAEGVRPWIVRAHPYKPRVGHPQVHLIRGGTFIEEYRQKCLCHTRFLYFTSFTSLISLFFNYFNFYWYSWSMWRMAPFSSKATSKALAFFTSMSANWFSWARSTAWSLTISRTARKATIMAWREGQASKNWMRLTVEVSLERIWLRSWAIIWATVKTSWVSSMRTTSFLRSRTCWKTRTRSTRETTSSPSVPSSL